MTKQVRQHHLLGLGVALAALAALAQPGFAEDATTGINTALVRGGAPLPHFTSSFPVDLGGAAIGPAAKENLEISLTSPDHGVVHFLFSPRAVAGETYGFGPTVTGNYVGLAWSIFDNDRLFGNIALSGAVNRAPNDDPTHHAANSLVSLHSTFELGYSFGADQSLSLALDHATAAPYFGDRGTFGDDFRLRYGYHF